jgi:hypothetical protein
MGSSTSSYPTPSGANAYNQPITIDHIPPRYQIDHTSVPDTTPLKTLETERDDSQWEIGECISYDNVGPMSPKSIEGYRQFIAFRDTRSKYLFCYPVKTCNEDTFLYHLQRVLRFFTS